MITLQFSTQRGLESAVIRWATWSDVSHVDCVLPGGKLLGARSTPSGARSAGVQIREPNYGNFTRVLQVDYDVAGKEGAYYRFLSAQLDKPYDVIDILDFVFHRFRRRDWRDDQAWMCSELQARASEVAGASFLNFRIINPYKIDPADLLKSNRIVDWRVIL